MTFIKETQKISETQECLIVLEINELMKILVYYLVAKNQNALGIKD